MPLVSPVAVKLVADPDTDQLLTTVEPSSIVTVYPEIGLPLSCGVAHDTVTSASPALTVSVSSASGGLTAGGGGVVDVALGDGVGEAVSDGDGEGDGDGDGSCGADGPCGADGSSGATVVSVAKTVGDGAGAAAVKVGVGAATIGTAESLGCCGAGA